ncbi:uncharacterized protein TNCV_2578421 [Trichonephila clavipes]|nr:uncharacterized protein TNCV_2578421 [Trichonephila clavipes]
METIPNPTYIVRRPVGGRPRVTTPAEDQYIATVAKRNRRAISTCVTSLVTASNGYRTNLHIFKRGSVTPVRYRDEVLEPIVRLYAAAVGSTFVLMDDNARPHRADIVDDYLEREGTAQGEKDFNDEHGEENTDFVQSIPGFQECDEDVETWMACDAEDSGFHMLNDHEIVTSVQEKSDPVDDETDEDEGNNYDESNKGPSNDNALFVLETAME